jgi:hypothetical protein
MIRKALVILLLTLGTISVYSQQAKNTIAKNIPSLASVSGIWINADTLGIEPSIRNFRAQALVGKDMASIGWFASAPYSGGYHSGVMRINGKAPIAQLFRWYPYQSLRKATEPTYKIASTVKMIPDNNGVMWEITITNTTAKAQHYDIDQDLIGFISHYDKAEWPWGYPYPTLHGKTNARDEEIVNVIKNVGLDQSQAKAVMADQNDKNYDPSKVAKITWPSDGEILSSSKYKMASYTPTSFIVSDNETDALVGFKLMDAPDKIMLQNSGGTAKWAVNLKPGASKKIRFFMAWGNNQGDLTADMNKWANSFDATFAGVNTTWETRWKELFTPNNDLVSGCFPVLATKDKTVSRIYYAGPLTYLYLMNTNLLTRKRVILTGGTRWGATVTFFWDEAECSEMMAMVDPVMLKDQLKAFLQVDPDKHFGQDNYGGKGQGNAYVSNYWAIFQLIRSYITITKDYGFLDEVVGDKKVIDHLYDYAYNWKKVSIYGQPGATDDTYKLADFGSDPWNLLECVPTYIHIVPSFNAEYVWMMRETAKYYQHEGDADKAKQLDADAADMAKRVLKLYAGDGVWNALYPNGKKVPIRHVLDFMYVGKYMSDDLPPQMRKEMVDFAFRELITDKWMRAQSIQDIAAKASDRPDHGPLGAYDGWPPGTIDALAQLGYAKQALQFYKSVLPVTVEGNWSQSHELWGDNKFNKKGRVRIDERGWNCRDAIAGVDFSQVILKAFMGFYPGIDGSTLQPVQKVGFSGTMYHVLYGGRYYNVSYSNGKSWMVAE